MKITKKKLPVQFACLNSMKTINPIRALECSLHVLTLSTLHVFSYGSKKQTIVRFAEHRYEAISKHKGLPTQEIDTLSNT